MVNTKLYHLLQTFSTKETRLFEQLLGTDLFENHPLTLQLYQVLSKSAASRLTKEKVWEKLYPKKVFNDAKLRRLCNQLYSQAESFLELQGYRKKSNTERQVRYLLPELRQRQLHKSYRFVRQVLETAFEETEQQDADHFYNLTAFLFELDTYEVATSPQTYMPELEVLIAAFDNYYFANKLRYSNTIVNNNRLKGKATHIPFIVEVLDHINKQDLFDCKVINLYYLMYLMNQNRKPEYFDRAFSLIQTNPGLLSHEELLVVYYQLLNFLIQYSRISGDDVLLSLRNLYLLGLERKLIYTDAGYLAAKAYKNIVDASLRTGFVDWVGEFIEEHESQLHPSQINTTGIFCRAYYLYFKALEEEFDREAKNELLYQSLELADQMESKDVNLIIAVKSLHVKIFFELEHAHFDSLLHTFRQYIRNQKNLSSQFCNAIINRLKFVQKLFKINQLLDQKAKKAKLKILENEVNEAELIDDKTWLLNQITQILQNKKAITSK